MQTENENCAFLIRPAGERDLPALIELLELLFDLEQDFQPDRERQRAGLRLMLGSPCAALLVAEGTEGVVAGFCGVQLLGWYFQIPYPLYLLLIIILIWASINVVNCTDGVDGLSASVAVVSMGTFALLYGQYMGAYVTATAVFVGALLAYLWGNAKPSSVLMGDAGSRAMGFFLALLALKSGHPFAFLLAALVFIADGSLGILKISFKRFLHISILKNTLTPLHDHARKRLGWSDEQVVIRWVVMQCVASAVLAALAGFGT